jgi:pyruvate/2-oxoglutarate dehydrogenase complex dihydrolipoamide dehydrogenase (E3) component
MPETLQPDICVIGAGSGGLSVAAAAAAFGAPVVLVERGRMGGDCLNYGCVPSKSLLAAAKRAAAFTRASDFGVTGGSPTIDFAKVRSHVRDVIAAIAPNDSTERFTGLGVRVIAGTAQFKDAATVAVGDAFEIKARRFVIATGSSPAIPPIPGLADTPHVTNETIFDLDQCPAHLLVIGGGPIGLELAQAFRRLGAAVTVLEAAVPLAKDDPECAAVVLDQLARDGVAIRAGVAVRRVAGGNGKVQVVIGGADQEETIEGSHLLVATGRTPNVADLGLDRAGIKFDPRGIVVDKRLRTTNARVYAIGDVAGGLQFTHVANYHAGLVVRHALFRLPVAASNDALPRVTFTDPELAHVGLSEAEARARRYKFQVLRWPYHQNDRAQAERTTEGHIKVVTTRGGRILGATIVGHNAGELIATWSLAVGQRLNIRAVATTVLPYPTLSEIGKRAAITRYTASLTSPMVRRIMAWLRRLG